MQQPPLSRFLNSLSRPPVLLVWGIGVALLRFVNLGFLDLQPWDEAAHNIRAYSIHVFGDFLDQTSHALGGLTTSSFPPLSIWMTALAYHFFGASEWTTRLFAALSGVGSVVLVGAIVFRSSGARAAIFSSLLLGTNLFFTFYTRQGQLDSPYVFFMTLAVYGWLLFVSEPRPRLGLALIAVATWGALMSKILVGLYIPLLLLALQMLERAPDHRWKRLFALAAAVGVGVLLALPWHLYMLSRYGKDFIDAYFLFHIVGRTLVPLDAHSPALGWLYFVNQIPVRFPEAGLGLGLIASWWGSGPRRDPHISRLVRIALVWIVLVLIPITIMATKIVHYILPLAIPFAALGGVALDRVAEGSLSRKGIMLIVIPYGLFAAWSGLAPLRVYIKSVMMKTPVTVLGMEAQGVFIILAAISAITVGLLALRGLSWEKAAGALRAYPFIVLLVLSAALVYEVFVRDPVQYDYGIRSMASLLRERQAEGVVYLGADLNPALRLYLHGWNGWNTQTQLMEYVPTAASTIVPVTPEVNLPIGRQGWFLVIEQRVVRSGYYLREENLAQTLPVVFRNDYYTVYLLWEPGVTVSP